MIFPCPGREGCSDYSGEGSGPGDGRVGDFLSETDGGGSRNLIRNTLSTLELLNLSPGMSNCTTVKLIREDQGLLMVRSDRNEVVLSCERTGRLPRRRVSRDAPPRITCCHLKCSLVLHGEYG